MMLLKTSIFFASLKFWLSLKAYNTIRVAPKTTPAMVRRIFRFLFIFLLIFLRCKIEDFNGKIKAFPCF